VALTALQIMKARVRGAGDQDDATLEVYLDMAADQLCETAWGATLYLHAQALFAGHQLQRFVDAGGGGGAAVGGVTMQKDGDLSRSYGAPATSNSESALATTQAGLDYLQLIRSSIPAVYTDVLTGSGVLGFP